MPKLWLLIGSISGFFGVLLGAFGAHALKDVLDEKAQAIYHTAVEYQFIHSLALMALGMWASQNPFTRNRIAQNFFMDTRVAGISFTLGLILFSGSLYALAITQLKFLGIITPFGGISFLVGWIAFAFLIWKA